MRIKDIKTPQMSSYWVKPVTSDQTLKCVVGRIELHPSLNGYGLHTHNASYHIHLKDAHKQLELDSDLQVGQAHIAEIESIAKDGSALLKIIYFYGGVMKLDQLTIAISESVESIAHKQNLKFNTLKQLCKILKDRCTFRIGNKMYYTMRTFDNLSEGNEESGYMISGDRLSVPVYMDKDEYNQSITVAKKLVFNQVGQAGALRLVCGELDFTDTESASQLDQFVKSTLEELHKNDRTFMNQWDKYGAIEGELLLDRAKRVGVLNYHTAKALGGAIDFFFDKVPEGLQEDDMLTITDSMPPYILKPDMTWQQYADWLTDKWSNTDHKKASQIYGKIIEATSKRIRLKMNQVPDQALYLVLSIEGDKVQIDRRMKAREAILYGKSANPLLGLIIESGSQLPTKRPIKRTQPLSGFVREKIFEHDPTEVQIDAIDIALNTPDIALIQGPPGTGKTTVVTAILERLNEMMDKSGGVSGNVLISGFQHDAVENIISRLSINSLPTIKFGRRASESEYSADVTEAKLTQFSESVIDKIRAKNPQIHQNENEKKLKLLMNSYLLNPSDAHAIGLLEMITELSDQSMPQPLRQQADVIIKVIQSETQKIDEIGLRYVRRLRTHAESFKDDGPTSAMNVLIHFDQSLMTNDKELLQKAAFYTGGMELNFLDDLEFLKDELLNQCSPAKIQTVDKHRFEVLELANQVTEHLKRSQSYGNKKDIILANFVHELSDNPGAIKSAMASYNTVYAATTQQSEGKEIRIAKNLNRDDQLIYDTVIIDEAARTSPRDLMIPMAQGKRRIILVGDHKQLPHLIDTEVSKLLEEGDNINMDFIEESMFKYLFRRAKELESQDHIRRTVTLDAQYRTHPILGDFVSDQFYKADGQSYRSDLPAEKFDQTLKGIEHIPSIWIDVPNKRGREDKEGHSRRRLIEADVIANQLAEWIDSKDAEGLSFGIISFYRGQVNLIMEALRKKEIAERVTDDSIQIKKEYQLLENGDERIRVGTVDAFQGMEFDVVFLSMVRTETNQNIKKATMEENQVKAQRMIFGHLMSPNRLCVAMSRQKKALIMVGNAALANSTLGSRAVPQLKAYYALCQQQGGVL